MIITLTCDFQFFLFFMKFHLDMNTFLTLAFHSSRVLALDLEGVHDLKLHHPSSSVATSNQ